MKRRGFFGALAGLVAGLFGVRAANAAPERFTQTMRHNLPPTREHFTGTAIWVPERGTYFFIPDCGSPGFDVKIEVTAIPAR